MKTLFLTLVVLSLFGCGKPVNYGGNYPHGNPYGTPTPTPGPGEGELPARTMSTWIGTNLSSDLVYVDITHMMNPFNTAAGSKDANGYPVAGASGLSHTDIGFLLTSGTYKISYKGTGTVTVGGIASLASSWQTVNGERRNTLTVTGAPEQFGRFFDVTITNGGGQTVSDLHIYYPGHDYGDTDVFLPEFLRLLKPFRNMRFMDWMATNGNTIVDWSDRPRYAAFGKSSFGEPYENITELANVTGKDVWINIPEKASDDFVRQLAKQVRDGLNFDAIGAKRHAQGDDSSFKVYFEYSNETWNGGFSAYNTLLALANANPSRYTGSYDHEFGPSWMYNISDLMKVGQYEADRLAQIGDIFREEFDSIGKKDILAPVLSGWAIGAAYSDVGLKFLLAKYGSVTPYVSYVATAPYFGPDDGQTGSLASLFTSMSSAIAGQESNFVDFKKLVDKYGLGMVTYEGGQGISGNSNLTIKQLANQDQRMYDAYKTWLALWQKHFGKSLFMHYSLAGGKNAPDFVRQWGFWDSIPSTLIDPAVCGQDLPTLAGTENVSFVTDYCPKYQALQELAGE
jgi:hypothetical protein